MNQHEINPNESALNDAVVVALTGFFTRYPESTIETEASRQIFLAGVYNSNYPRDLSEGVSVPSVIAKIEQTTDPEAPPTLEYIQMRGKGKFRKVYEKPEDPSYATRVRFEYRNGTYVRVGSELTTQDYKVVLATEHPVPIEPVTVRQVELAMDQLQVLSPSDQVEGTYDQLFTQPEQTSILHRWLGGLVHRTTKE